MNDLSSYRLFRISAAVPNETEHKGAFTNVLHKRHYVNHTRNTLTVNELRTHRLFRFIFAQ